MASYRFSAISFRSILKITESVKLFIRPAHKLWLVRAGLVCLALTAIFLQGCDRGADSAADGGKKKGKGGRGGDTGPVPVVVARVQRKTVPIQLSAVGNVEAYNTVSIRPQVSGQLTQVFIQEGDYVKKGDKLFEIDRRPFEAQLSQAKATLSRDTAGLGQARANLAKDSANEKYAREQSDRYAKLFEQGVVSKDDRERFASQADALKQAMEADDAAIDSAKAQIEADEANVRNFELQLSFTMMYAPIDGRSGNIAVKVGNIVNANQTDLMSITQVEPIYVTFSIPEARLGDVQRYSAHAKLPVEAKSQDGSASDTGTLTFIDNNVDTTTGTIKLKGTYPNPSHSLWPGEFVNVTLKLSSQADALVIPNQALQSGQDISFVYVVKPDKTVEMRPVTVGLRVDNDLVIDKGISDGETVVTEGQLRLAPGSRVILPNDVPKRGGDAVPASEVVAGDASARKKS